MQNSTDELHFPGLGNGVRVLDCGLASTPAMFMSTIFDETKADGSIMLTASHLPFNRNGMKIIVDAGNGSGGFFADKILAPLGADVNGSQFLEPDGMFPNHIPNPEDKIAMASLKKAVLDKRADLGLIFDTDVDRAGAVFSDGEEISRNALIALTRSQYAVECREQ